MGERRKRDVWRKRLYAAEMEAFASDEHGRIFKTLPEAQEYVFTVQGLDSLLSGLPWVGVEAAHGNAKGSWACFEDHTVSLALGGCCDDENGENVHEGVCEQVILHELAHIATGGEVQWHGREFCWNYLDLTLRWRGPSMYLQLRDAIRKQGIL